MFALHVALLRVTVAAAAGTVQCPGAGQRAGTGDYNVQENKA